MRVKSWLYYLSITIIAISIGYNYIPDASAQSALDPFVTYDSPSGVIIKFSPKWNVLPINNMSASVDNSTCNITITNPILSSMPTTINFNYSVSWCYGVLYMYNNGHFYTIVNYSSGSGGKITIRHYYYNSTNNTWNYTTIGNDIIINNFYIGYIMGYYINESNFNKLYILNFYYRETYIIENGTLTTKIGIFVYFPAVDKYIRLAGAYIYITDNNFNNISSFNFGSSLTVYNLIQIALDKAYISIQNSSFILDLTNNIKIDNPYSSITFDATKKFLINDVVSAYSNSSIYYSGGGATDMSTKSLILNSSKLPYALLNVGNASYSFTNLNVSQNKVNYTFPSFSSSNKISYSFDVINSPSFNTSYYNYTWSWSKINSTKIRVTLSNSVFGFPTTIDFNVSNLNTYSPSEVYFIINATSWDSSGKDAILFYYNPYLNHYDYSWANSSSSNYVIVISPTTQPTFFAFLTLPNNLVFYHAYLSYYNSYSYRIINLNTDGQYSSAIANAYDIWYTASYIYFISNNRIIIYQPTTTPSLINKLNVYLSTNFILDNIIEKSPNEVYFFTNIGIFKFNGSTLLFIKQYSVDSYFTNTNMAESVYGGKYLYTGKNMFFNYNALPATSRQIEINSSRQSTTVTQSFTNQTMRLINPLYVNLDITINSFDYNNISLINKFNEQNFIWASKHPSFVNFTNPSTALFPTYQTKSIGITLNNNYNIIYVDAINVGINGNDDYIIPSANIFYQMDGVITSSSIQILLDPNDRYKNFINFNNNISYNSLNINAIMSLNGKYYFLSNSVYPIYIKDFGNKYMLYKDNYAPAFLDKTQDQFISFNSTSPNIKYIIPYEQNLNYYLTYYTSGSNTNLEKRDLSHNIISTYPIGNPSNHSIFNNLIIFTNLDKIFNLITEEIYDVESGNFNYILKQNKYYKYPSSNIAYFLDDNIQYSFNNNIPVEATVTNKSNINKKFAVIHGNSNVIKMSNNHIIYVNDNIVELDKDELYKISRGSYYTYIKPVEDFISTTTNKIVALIPQSGLAGNTIYFLEIRHKDIPLYYPATPVTRGNSSTALLENSLYVYNVNMYIDDTAGNPTPQFPLGCSGKFVDTNTTSINVYCSESVTLKSESYIVNIVRDNTHPNRIITITEQIFDLNSNGYEDELSKYRPLEIRVQDLNGAILYTTTITDNTTPLNLTVNIGANNENKNKLVFLILGDPSSNDRNFLRYEWFISGGDNVIKDILLNMQNYYGLNIVFFIVVLLAGLYNRSNQGVITVIIIALILFFSSIGLITLTPIFIAIIVIIAVAYLIYTKSIGWG